MRWAALLPLLLLLLLFAPPGASISQNDYVILTTFQTSAAVDLDHLGRASTQLERAYRFQSGYTERDFLLLPTANTYMDVNVWDGAASGVAGIAATATNPAVLAFNALVTTRTNVTYTVSRAFTAATPTAGTYSRLYRFSLVPGATDDSFISATTSLSTLYTQQPGFLELVLVKATVGQSWAVFSKWTTAAALAAGLNATAAGSAAFWQRIDNTTLTQTNLTLARSFRNPTLGTPSTQVMFDTFYLNEGQDTAVFLANLADAEAALQGELGYLGRNLEWGHDGRFSIQWWWTTRAYLDSSLTRISSYTFAAAINASSLARRFFVTKASFQPWIWNKTIACGAPIQTRQYSLATGVAEADYLNRIQTAEDAYRAQGLVEWNVLQDYDRPWLYMDIGYQWQNYTVAYTAANAVAANPISSPVVLAVNASNATATTYYYLKGFWAWTDTSYSCSKRWEVDPAVTGVPWSDFTLRRPPPLHEVTFPPPGITPNGKLMVFLPDFGRSPAEYLQFLNQAAGLGYLGIGLVWLNGFEVRRLCVGDSTCFKGLWDALLFGATDSSPPLVLDVAVGDSITYRLLVLLQYLNATAPWTGAARFYGPAGLRYDRMVWVGAGDGASAAFSLAQSQLVDRVVAYDGPIDDTVTGNQWLVSSSVTPKDRWYEVASQLTGRCQAVQLNAAKANVTAANQACFTQSLGGVLDSAVMQSWVTFYIIAEEWQFTLSQCSTSGLTSAQYANITKGLPYSCDGTGEPYLYASKPAVYLASACAGCNLTTYATLSVTPFGYDRGTCTLVSPCRTIQYAVNTAAPGSRIAIQRGVYTENVVIPVDKANLTLIGEVDSDGVQQSILQCSSRINTNVCLQVYAPRVTITLMAINHPLSLPAAREVGVMFMPTATAGVVQRSTFSRIGVLDSDITTGSRAVEVAGAGDVGIFDNQIKGTYQAGVSVLGPRTSVLRNLVWGDKGLTAVGILVLAAGTNSTISGNRIRIVTGSPGDGIQIQSDGNLVQKNKVWRNMGVAIRICGPGTACVSPWPGTCAQMNVVRQNRLGWNQGGWIVDMGCGTSLTCHSFQSVFAPASCTPMLMYVNSASGSDTDCTFNNVSKKCQTINGAIARSQARYWIILEDSQYTEAVPLAKEGLVLRSNQLNSYPLLLAPGGLAGPIVNINASNVSLESVDVRNTNAAPTVQEIGVYIAPAATNTNVEDCRFSRVAATEPTSPGSRGVFAEGPNTAVLENTFSGTYQYQLTLTAANAYVWENTINQAGQIGILLLQQPPPATTNGSVVRDNYVAGAGLDGIQIQGDFSIVEFNTVVNAQRVGIHLCASSNTVGPGGACQWTSLLNTVEAPQGNVVKENIAIRSPVNFIDDLNSTANDYTYQLPRYEPVGITDPSDVLTTQWIAAYPTSAVVGGVVPLRVIGYWERGFSLQIKLAAGVSDCYGFAPVVAGGAAAAAVDSVRNIGTVGPVTVAGEYLVCIKHRQDWEPTQSIVTVGALDRVSVFAGAPSCLAALQATTAAPYCGCWFRRGSPADTYFLAAETPLSVMSTGTSDIAINQGCCVRNTPVRTGPNYVDAVTSWGLCSDSVSA